MKNNYLIICVFVFCWSILFSKFHYMHAETNFPSEDVDGIEEIVVVGTDGRVYVYDYDGELVFQSSQTGWVDVAVADLNGDGDKEIIAVGQNRIKVYDPQKIGSELYRFETTYTSNDGSFTKVGTGHFVGGDGQIDIAVMLSVEETQSRLIIYNMPHTKPVQDVLFESTNWQEFAIGDYDGDDDDDFALIDWYGGYLPNNRSWFELRKGHDPSQLLDDENNASKISSRRWFDIASGNFVKDNGKTEWVALRADDDEGDNHTIAQQWDGNDIVDVWGWDEPIDDDGSLDVTQFEFVATADFRNDDDDQVVMLRNVDKGVSLQFGKIGSIIWATTSGLGTGWLNLAAGNLDSDDDDSQGYKEAVIIKENLIRVFLKPQAGVGGDSSYLDCSQEDNCLDIGGSFNGALAVGDLGVHFQMETAEPYAVSPVTIGRRVGVSETVPSQTVFVHGEKETGTSLKWGAAIIPDYLVQSFKRDFEQNPNLSLSITPHGVEYKTDEKSVTVPNLPWMTLSAFTGTTPSTITAIFSNTHHGSPLLETKKLHAMIIFIQKDIPNDRFRYIDVTVVVLSDKIYIPIVIK